MKIALLLNWVTHYVECTPAEVDTINKVLGRAAACRDEERVDGRTVLTLDTNAPTLDYKIRVLPESTTINSPE